MIAPTILPGAAYRKITRGSRLLFHWRASDRSLVTVDGLSTGTFTRASAGGLTDGRGHVRSNSTADVRLVGPTADNEARWGITSTNGPFLFLEDTRKNWQPISNPSTGWQVSTAFSTGGETTVAPDGTLVTLLTDNSTVATEQMVQDVEVASTVAIITWYTKWNGSTFGATHRMNLTGAADRGQVVWKFGSTGAMTITSTGAGSVVSAPSHIGNNWWKTSLEASSIVIANDNQIEITPALTAVGTTGGDMFIAHIQVESVASTGLFASSHIPTAGSAVTRAAEVLSWPFVVPPRSMTVYVSMLDWVPTVSDTIWHIGAAAATDPRIVLATNASGQLFATFDDGSTEAATGTLAAPSAGDNVEVLVTLTSAGVVDIAYALNGGSQVDAASATGGALATAWAGQLLYLNSVDTSTPGFGRFSALKIAPRVQSMATMKEAF